MRLFLRYNMILPKPSREALRSYPGTPAWLRDRLPKGQYELTETPAEVVLTLVGSPEVLRVSGDSPLTGVISKMRIDNFEVSRG